MSKALSVIDDEFCYATFTNLFIAGNGDVFPCCSNQKKEVIFGNLHTNTVDEILNGIRIQSLRSQSVNKTLPCRTCNYGHKTNNPKNLTEEQLLSPFQDDYIGKIQLELGFFCVSRCIFCEQPHSSKTHLPYDKVKEILRRTQPHTLQLQGGEAYYVPGAAEFFEWLANDDSCQKIQMHTNCVLPIKTVPLMLDILDEIYFNLYGATEHTFFVTTGLPFSKATDYIRQAIKMRKENNQENDKFLRFKGTITPTTIGDIPEYIRLSRELGVDDLIFAFDHGYYFKGIEESQLNNLFAQVNRALNKIDDSKVVIASLERFGFKRDRNIAPETDPSEVINHMMEFAANSVSGGHIVLPLYACSPSTSVMILGMTYERYKDAFAEALDLIRKKYGNDLPIVVSYLLQDTTFHDLPNVIEFVHEHKISAIEFNWSDSIRSYLLRYNNEAIVRIMGRVHKAFNSYPIKTAGLNPLHGLGYEINESGSVTTSKEIPGWKKQFLHELNSRREHTYQSKDVKAGQHALRDLVKISSRKKEADEVVIQTPTQPVSIHDRSQ